MKKLGSEKFSSYIFGYFQTSGNESMANIANELKLWDFKSPLCISIISKQNGIGKTGLAVCLYRKFIYNFFKQHVDNNVKCYYRELREMYEHYELRLPTHAEFISAKKLDLEIRMSYNSKYGRNEQEILDYYSRKQFLVIDDIFSSSDTDFSRRNLLYILDERLEFNCLPTVITSNYDFESLKKIDTRISSRMNISNGFFEIVSKQEDLRAISN